MNITKINKAANILEEILDEEVSICSTAGDRISEALGLLRDRVTGAIERGEAEPILELQRYTVIGVSSNTNSFGLKSIILLNEQGETWEILKSPYGGEELPEQGDTLDRVGGQFKTQHEGSRRLKDNVPAVARKIISQAKK